MVDCPQCGEKDLPQGSLLGLYTCLLCDRVIETPTGSSLAHPVNVTGDGEGGKGVSRPLPHSTCNGDGKHYYDGVLDPFGKCENCTGQITAKSQAPTDTGGVVIGEADGVTDDKEGL